MARIQGDRPLAGDGKDELGFGPTAERLAEALASGTSSDGLVVGVTGKWGSGKSSLINLTQAALRRRVPANRPHVVEFKPWLVGDRDALLQGMFAELVSGIDQIELEAGNATGFTLRKTERATTALREFAGLLGGVGKVVKAGGAWIPWLGGIGGLLEDFFRWMANGKSKSLTSSKKKVCDRLAKLKRALVVVIDDVDRLDPAEIVEVLRLVRSVADFPNITYVLSYDQEIVSHAVLATAKVKDGHAYIEKIVQITLPVPIPEAFDLRRWFERELWAMDFPATTEVQQRIGEIIDYEGGRYLLTPRSVVRTLDSIRFYWTVLNDLVDLSDFIWLQFVKVGNPTLYEWITVYLTEMSACASGRSTIPEHQKAKARISLDAALKREDATFGDVCSRLADHLPGISHYHTEPEGGIYERVDQREMERAIGARRLASPDHYRLYFAFAQPTNAPRVSDFIDLTSALSQSADQAEELLRQWQGQRLTSGVTRAEVMLDRLSANGLASPTPGEAKHLLMAYANVMDDLGERSVNDFGGPDVWRRAMRSLPVLFEALGDQRKAVVRQMFTEGTALLWLTSIFRHETFAHGRHGDRPDSDRLLTSDELDVVTEVMLARYKAMSLSDFTASSRPLSMLFAWQQGGDDHGPRTLLANGVESDEGLISVLEHLCGRVHTATPTSVREIVTLSRSNISSLVDYEQSRARITALAENATDEVLRAKAKTLLRSFEDGDRF
ncbi:Predicted P-loop ATPase, KAP-like [Sphingobium sp. YR657]|uniref:KAP family P-loop NTPase fold protein n=1 Tax=Sphingobium sp. YR657 TaxID=1884366 RepID=UPI00091C18F0|nr:P-loop NTPase fold protein [Sphingobium sp. YR657]SHM44778.1 Predicted P-loop ATPase, KAP-like [Sphingobium sp. YR657]